MTGDEGRLDLAKLDELLTPEVKVFAFTHISNTMGTINPAAELCRRAREVGAVTLVDAAQSAGHYPVDVRELGCDFLVFSGHKVLGPTGIGVLYGRAERLEETPPYQTGGEMIVTVDWQRATYKPAPHRFEAGTPNMAGAVGLHAAFDYLDSVGRRQIFDHDQALAAYAYGRLRDLGGVRLLGPGTDRAGLVSFLLDDAHAHDVVTMADVKYGVALRGGHPLQPAAAPQTRRALLRACFVLLLQHPRGGGRFHRRRRGHPNFLPPWNLTAPTSRNSTRASSSTTPADRGTSASCPTRRLPPAATTRPAATRSPSNSSSGRDGHLDDVKFHGDGCSICMASASMMTTKIKNKGRADAEALRGEFQAMLANHVGTDADAAPPSKALGDLRLLQGVRKFPQRIKCATLAWHALRQALNDGGGGAKKVLIDVEGNQQPAAK